MKKKSKTPLIIVLGVVIVVIAIAINNAGPDYYFEGNVRQFTLLALVQDNTRMDCDAFNQISVTYDDGAYQTLANGRQGITPFVDDSAIGRTNTDGIITDDLARFNTVAPLDLTTNGRDIQEVHFEVALDCSGSAMDGTTTVSGLIHQRICLDPAKGGSTCLIGNEKRGIEFEPETISPVTINDSQVKVIHTRTYDEPVVTDQVRNKFGTIFFKHETYPVLQFDFNHPTDGTFSGSYDAFIEDQKIIAQFGLIENTDPSGKQTGGPPAPDDPSTGNKSLRINSWTPQILDTSQGEHIIDISVGIENLDLMELTPTIKLTKLDGFVKDNFDLPNSCVVSTLGWQDCDLALDIELSKYPKGSYKIEFGSEQRTTDIAYASFEVVDQTPPLPPNDQDGDGIPDSEDLCPTMPETFNGFEDFDGCPDTIPDEPTPTDRDGDGIDDVDDECPDDPETYNGFEDTDGCPDSIIAPPIGGGGGSGGGSGGGGGGSCPPENLSCQTEEAINSLLGLGDETQTTTSGIRITRSTTNIGGIGDNELVVVAIIGSVIGSAVLLGRYGGKF